MGKGKLKKTAFSLHPAGFQTAGTGAREPAVGSSNWKQLTDRYSLDLLKSQIFKATRRRGPEGAPVNGRIPRYGSVHAGRIACNQHSRNATESDWPVSVTHSFCTALLL